MMTSEQASGASRVIIVDDDGDLLSVMTQGLKLAGFEVEQCTSATEALQKLSPQFEGAILSDVRMPEVTGLEFFERVRKMDDEVPVILITGHGDVDMAVEALKNGAFDFLTKPFRMDKLVASLRQAIAKRRLVMENRQLRAMHANSLGAQGLLLGDSDAIVHLRQTLTQIAEVDLDVLITGDTGTGKETAARTLHRMSRRRSKPFVHVNFASLAAETFRGDLFGAELGARASHLPVRRTTGRLERADKGFVLFDEVDALSLGQQASLLDFVETRKIWAVGSDEPRSLDVRIIATSKRNLKSAVETGAFRADLYYRLSGVSIQIPPINQRRSDALLLFQHFVARAAANNDRPIPRLTEELLAFIETHDWPGNVRELEQFAERFLLGLALVGRASPMAEDGAEQSLAAQVARFEASIIKQTLEHHHGKVGPSAEALGLARKTFYDKLAKHNILVSAYRERDAEQA